jgi:ABC-type branched-subunit amino acid transport system ATPase component
MLLEMRELTKQFGGRTAVSQFDLSVEAGQIVGLIGPKGGGKSILLNLVTGIVLATTGPVIYEGKNITGRKPHQVAAPGTGRTFQLSPLFCRRTGVVDKRHYSGNRKRPHSTGRSASIFKKGNELLKSV